MTERFSKWVCEKADLDSDEYMIRFVNYFIELLIFQIYETAIMLCVAYMFGILNYVLLVMAGFLPFRISGKGIHADSKIKCIFYSTLSFTILGFVGSQIGIIGSIMLGIMFAIILRKKT